METRSLGVVGVFGLGLAATVVVSLSLTYGGNSPMRSSELVSRGDAKTLMRASCRAKTRDVSHVPGRGARLSCGI
jgi:hypothetical protein